MNENIYGYLGIKFILEILALIVSWLT
jgi:hypothetical protein